MLRINIPGTLMYNGHVTFSRCWNTCILHNKIVGYLAALNNCSWCSQLLVVLFVPVSFIFYLYGTCVPCAFWCVYYVYYVYMGQMPEIKLIMKKTDDKRGHFEFSRISRKLPKIIRWFLHFSRQNEQNEKAEWPRLIWRTLCTSYFQK